MFHFCGRPTWSYTLQDLDKGLPSNLHMFHCSKLGDAMVPPHSLVRREDTSRYFSMENSSDEGYWPFVISFSTTILSEGCIELGVKGPSPNCCRPRVHGFSFWVSRQDDQAYAWAWRLERRGLNATVRHLGERVASNARR